jgi:hypothetical protein
MRPAGRAAAAGITAAAVWAAAEQLAGRRTVRVSALLALAAVMAGKTLADPKAAALEDRYATSYPTFAAAGVHATDAISRLNNIAAIGAMGATGGPYATFGGATDGATLKANINATIADLNDLAGDVGNIRARVNQIYTTAS